MSTQIRTAVLDDYQDVALRMADWSALRGRATVEVFNDHVATPDAVVARLEAFDVVCVMRERTSLTRVILERLPRLRLIASTGAQNAVRRGSMGLMLSDLRSAAPRLKCVPR